MKVLTHSGFRSFDGIIDQGIKGNLLSVIFDDDDKLTCTYDHELLLENGEFIPACFLEIGDVLHFKKVVKRIVCHENQETVYDLLNVEEVSSYITNGVVSHNCNIIFLDEFAFIENPETFYTSTYPVISSGKNTKVIITSTANGVGNLYHRLWEGAVQGANEYKPFRVDWYDVPGRDEVWKKQTIANTSELQFEQEFGNQFTGTGNTLISSDKLLGLQAIEPIKIHRDVNYYVEPQETHNYVMMVDVSRGRGQDYSTFTVVDVSSMPFEQVATFRDNMISPLLFPDVIVRVAKTYNNAMIVIESNDAGQVVCNAVYHEYEYENTFVESAVKAGGVGVTMTKRVKRIGCSNLKDLIESGKLAIHDLNTIHELSSFEHKGDSYQASGSTHDDMVMNLVLFAWFVSSETFGDISNIDLKQLLYSERMKEMEEDVPLFGIFHSQESHINPEYEAMLKAQREWGTF